MGKKKFFLYIGEKNQKLKEQYLRDLEEKGYEVLLSGNLDALQTRIDAVDDVEFVVRPDDNPVLALYTARLYSDYTGKGARLSFDFDRLGYSETKKEKVFNIFMNYFMNCGKGQPSFLWLSP